jgi:hypothetical protein
MSSSSSSVTTVSAPEIAAGSILDGWTESEITLPYVQQARPIPCFEKKGLFGRKRWVIIWATEIATVIAPFFACLGHLLDDYPDKPVGLDTEYGKSHGQPDYDMLRTVQEAFFDEKSDTGIAIVMDACELSASEQLAPGTLLPLQVQKQLRANRCTFCGNGVADDIYKLLLCFAPLATKSVAFPKTFDFTTVLRFIGVPRGLANTKLYTLAEHYLKVKAPEQIKCKFQQQNWLEKELTKDDIIYAGLDAIIGCELAEQHFRKMLPPPVDRAEASAETKPVREPCLDDVLEYYASAVKQGTPAPAGMYRKRQWILNSYNGHAARELKMRENERTLIAIVEAWDKHDLLVHGLPDQ